MKKILILLLLLVNLQLITENGIICMEIGGISAQTMLEETLDEVTVTGNSYVNCDWCGDRIRKDNLIVHLQQYCRYRSMTCQTCHQLFYLSDGHSCNGTRCSLCGYDANYCKCGPIIQGNNNSGSGSHSGSTGGPGHTGGGTNNSGNSPSSGSGSGSTSNGQDTRTIMGETVPSKVVNFLKSLKKGGEKINVTSVKRTVRSQAVAMLNNIKNTGVAAQKRIYGHYGDIICDAYNKNLSDEENIQNFMSIMNSYTDPSVFSHHLGGYDRRCTFDISQSALQNSADLFQEIKNMMIKSSPNYDPNILKVYYENRCIHIEYKIKD